MTYNFDTKIVDNTDVSVALAAFIPVNLSEGYAIAEYRYENKLGYMPNNLNVREYVKEMTISLS